MSTNKNIFLLAPFAMLQQNNHREVYMEDKTSGYRKRAVGLLTLLAFALAALDLLLEFKVKEPGVLLLALVTIGTGITLPVCPSLIMQPAKSICSYIRNCVSACSTSAYCLRRYAQRMYCSLYLQRRSPATCLHIFRLCLFFHW